MTKATLAVGISSFLWEKFQPTFMEDGKVLRRYKRLKRLDPNGEVKYHECYYAKKKVRVA